jgi:hypothetical protein
MVGTSNNAFIQNIRKNVRDLISLNERLQSALIQGERLTPDERDIVRLCSVELLSLTLEKDLV